ncbi:MAG: hypothetical protein DRQ55_00825 [Planctomycetota bacterium]|nr:MAG: hypothetical protein DRQ55_00825 [Planctomycetota bacterium]
MSAVVPDPDKPIDPEHTGGLRGRVVLGSPAPAPEPLLITGDSYCVGAASEAGGYVDESLRVRDGALAGAFVWVRSGLDGWELPEPKGVVELDQRGCMYRPRVVGVVTGQTLRVLNSDGVLHNVHTKPKRNRARNLAMPGEVLQRELQFKREEVMIELACDIHAWMKGWIGVVEHPFFCVTDEEGRWSLEGLPPGSYELGVWHERLGTRALSVDVSVGEQTDTGDVTLTL